MTFEQLKLSVVDWAWKRNLIQTTTPEKQLLKTMEELGGLARGFLKGDKDLIVDSFGDVMVTLILCSEKAGLDLEDCLEVAYDEIKNRTGKMVDGVFVKDAVLALRRLKK